METQDLKRRVRELYEQVSFSQEETRRLQMIEDAITKGAIEKACVLSMILATSTHKKANAAARLPTPVKMGRTSFFYRKSIHAAEQIMQQESEQFMLRAAKRRIRGPKAPASESLPSAA